MPGPVASLLRGLMAGAGVPASRRGAEGDGVRERREVGSKGKACVQQVPE